MKIEDFKEGGAWFSLPYSKNNTTSFTSYFGVVQEGTGLVKFLDNKGQYEYVHPHSCVQDGWEPRKQHPNTMKVYDNPVGDAIIKMFDEIEEAANEDDNEVFEEPKDFLSQFEKQYGGNHYNSKAIQPLEYILANNLPFCEGNVVKYITRHANKNGVEDLKKVIHYTMFILENTYGVRSKVEYDDGKV